MPGNSVVAIIPARAGSKRLPGKNKKMLAGKPLICWTIEAALAAKTIDTVIVSTDCPEIAEIAVNAGAEVPFLRPDHLSSDTATCVDVVEDMLEHLSQSDSRFTHVALLQPTSPLRNQVDIDSAFELLGESKSKGVVSVCPCEHPPLWTNSLPDDNNMSAFLEPLLAFRRSGKELESSYRLNGAICISEINTFLEERNFYYNQGVIAYRMPVERSVDIDQWLDFKLAECLLDEQVS